MKNSNSIVIFVAGFLLWVLASFVFMLGVGIVRAEWLHDLPTIGFWSSLIVTVVLMALHNLFTWNSVMNSYDDMRALSKKEK